MVVIGDLNDNSPLFTQETYIVTHDESNSNDLVVTKLTANDDDEGSNGRVEYRITGGNRNTIFYMDSSVCCLGDKRESLIQLFIPRGRWWQGQGNLTTRQIQCTL